MVFDTINFVLYQIRIIVNGLLHECFLWEKGYTNGIRTVKYCPYFCDFVGRRNEFVSIEGLMKICATLNCNGGDIIDFLPESEGL